MKRINTIFALAAGIAMFASCDINKTPVWSDDNAFAAFDKTAISVKEDAGLVKIPVTIASIDPVEVAVTYAAVDTLGAENGVNFKFTNESGVLSFDGEQRTAYIEVEIIDKPGVFTGDIKFAIDLTGAGDLNLGSNKTCVVTITDNDHPLAAILGAYNGVDETRGTTWTMEVRKDPTDTKTVWFYNICCFGSGWAGDDIMYYGTVDIDAGTITIPLGQESEYVYSNGNPVVLYNLDINQQYINDTGSYVITIKEDGKRLEFQKDYGLIAYIPDTGTIGRIAAGSYATKQ